MQRDIADPPSTTTEPETRTAAGPERPGTDPAAPAGRWGSRWALVIEGVIVYVVLQALTYPFLPAVRDRGQAFYNDVLIGFFGPEKHGLARILRSGVLPTWVNDQFGGEPFIANLQHALFYPGNLPFWIMRTSWAIDVVCAFHVAFAGLAMWAYCRFALRTSRWGAALAGLAFGFGSVTLQHIILMNQLQVIAWMPVVLLFGHLALERRQLRYVVLTGVAVGMQLLAGHPEEWVYTLLTLAVYGAGWVLVSKPREWPRRALSAVLRLGGALVAFVLLYAWQLLPTLLLQRNGWRTDPTFSQQFPLPKAMAFNALLPDYGHVLTGENVGFIGVVALGLAGLGIAAGPRRLLWARAVMLLLAVVGIIMALGNQNPVYRFVYDHVNLVAQFRVPSRYLLLTYFTTAAASALGMDALLYGRLGQWLRRTVAGVGALAVVGVLFGTALLFGGVSGYLGSRRYWVLAAGIGVIAWALANFRIVPRVVIALLLIGTTAVELRQARPGAEYHEMVPNTIYNDAGPIMDRLAADGGRYVTIAWDKPTTSAQRASIAIPPGLTGAARNYYIVAWPRRLAARPAWEYATGAETIIGRDGGLMPLRNYGQFFSAAVDPKGFLSGGITLQAPSQWDWTGLDFLGVRSFVTTTSLAANEAQVLRQHGFEPVEKQAFFQLWERPSPPMARMIYQADVVPTENSRLLRLKAGYQLLDRVMVNQPVGQLEAPTDKPVVDLVSRAYSKVDVTVRTSTEGILVLPDPYYPQWGVQIDGKPAKLLKVDHAFRGVKVPAGSHRVVFTYQDRYMQAGFVLSLLTLLGLIATWFWSRLRRLRPAGGPDADGDGHAGPEGNGHLRDSSTLAGDQPAPGSPARAAAHADDGGERRDPPAGEQRRSSEP